MEHPTYDILKYNNVFSPSILIYNVINNVKIIVKLKIENTIMIISLGTWLDGFVNFLFFI